MFGRDKSNDNNSSDDVTVPMQDISAPPLSDPIMAMTLPPPDLDEPDLAPEATGIPITVNSSDPTEEVSEEPATASEASELDNITPELETHETEPAETPELPAEPESLAESDTSMETETTAEPEIVATSPEPEAEIISSEPSSDLSTLKQNALRELSPLIDHLDQTPDEKYATAKMIYNETKDNGLLTAVFEAAKNLPDDKARATALHDVVTTIDSLN